MVFAGGNLSTMGVSSSLLSLSGSAFLNEALPQIAADELSFDDLPLDKKAEVLDWFMKDQNTASHVDALVFNTIPACMPLARHHIMQAIAVDSGIKLQNIPFDLLEKRQRSFLCDSYVENTERAVFLKFMMRVYSPKNCEERKSRATGTSLTDKEYKISRTLNTRLETCIRELVARLKRGSQFPPEYRAASMHGNYGEIVAARCAEDFIFALHGENDKKGARLVAMVSGAAGMYLDTRILCAPVMPTSQVEEMAMRLVRNKERLVAAGLYFCSATSSHKLELKLSPAEVSNQMYYQARLIDDFRGLVFSFSKTNISPLSISFI